MTTDTLQTEIDKSRKLCADAAKRRAKRRTTPLLPYMWTPEYRERLARFYEQAGQILGGEK